MLKHFYRTDKVLTAPGLHRALNFKINFFSLFLKQLHDILLLPQILANLSKGIGRLLNNSTKLCDQTIFIYLI